MKLTNALAICGTCVLSIFATLYVVRLRTTTVPPDRRTLERLDSPAVIPKHMTNDFNRQPLERRQGTVELADQEYKNLIEAWTLFTNYSQAPILDDEDQVLTGINAFRVEVYLAGRAKTMLTEEELRTKFEITLRRSGVSILSDSPSWLYCNLGAMEGEEPIVVYSCEVELREAHPIMRANGMVTIAPRIWTRSLLGWTSVSGGRKAMLEAAEQCAELLANKYLAANAGERR